MAPYQIWKVAPHLCGFPSDVARRRLLMALKAFIDESGKGDPPIFVMAGFIARAEEWAAFNDVWLGALEERFHMVAAVAAKDFRRINKCIEIIKQHDFPAIAVTVLHDDYRRIFGGRVSKRTDRPYFLIYHSLMALVFQWATYNGINEKIDLIFDEQREESDFLQSIFSKIMSFAPPEMKDRIGGRPIHVDDEEHPPLQAADILAWCIRRVVFCRERGEQTEDYVRTLLDKVKITHLHWTEEMLSGSLETFRDANLKNNMWFEHENNIVLANEDIIVSEFNQSILEGAEAGQTISLASIPAKGMRRFLLVYNCPQSDSPHLHRRVGDKCLAEID
jgi:hypothetical protein